MNPSYKKLRFDFFILLGIASLLTVVIMFWGDDVGLNTPERKMYAMGGVILGMLFFLFLSWLIWVSGFLVAVRALSAWVASRVTGKKMTQASLEKKVPPSAVVSDSLSTLGSALKEAQGRGWRYRQTWLLLDGDVNAIRRLSPELANVGYVWNDDVVLLHLPGVVEDKVDVNWLKQLYKLRRRRPVDGICIVQDGSRKIGAGVRGTSSLSTRLTGIADALHWSAPLFALDVASSDEVPGGELPVPGCEISPDDGEEQVQAALLTLRDRLARVGVSRLAAAHGDSAFAELSARLDSRAAPLAKQIVSLSVHRLRAVFFPVVKTVALPVKGGAKRSQNLQEGALAAADESSNTGTKTEAKTETKTETATAIATTWDASPLWLQLATLARGDRGRRGAWHPMTVFSALAMAGMGVWAAGMVASALLNQRDVLALQQTVRRVEAAPQMSDRLRGLLDLQQDIARYEHRTNKHAPWLTRFGLNRDDTILDALWTPYTAASQRMLVAPVQQSLETELVDLAQMRSDLVGERASEFAQSGHQALKSYLMLAEPSRADSGFLAPQLVKRWRYDADLDRAEQADMGERLLTFFAGHLAAHPDWRLASSESLVAGARQNLLAAIGVEHASSTLYRNILASAEGKYPDQTLATLTAGTDPRGLFRNNAVVAGMFTRQAYEESIAPAIADAAKQRVVASDWVLTGSAAPAKGEANGDASQNDLQTALTAQYFDEYAEQWQMFMNNLQWESATTMPAAIAQLKLMADARQSPLISLMKSVRYQANAGVRLASLSDNLVAKAQDLITFKKTAPGAKPAAPVGPLNTAFGPVLRLVGNLDGAAEGEGASVQYGGDLSLQRYLERVSALRLRLQQINTSVDGEAQARRLALTLFQGRDSELADTHAYAQLVAASLGEEWSGMGENLFVQPIAQATQTVLQPAQASLNDAWNSSITTPWQKAFSGRYPFAQTDNDASLPELARFMRPQGGLIAAFLQSQLAGVLELQGDRWVPVADSKLNFDPAFLSAVNTLQRIGARLLVQGEPQYRFDLQPIPSPAVGESVFDVDGQKLHYYNQHETWKNLVWPAPQAQAAFTRLQWKAGVGGSPGQVEYSGRWALIRLLERTRVDPVDSATYQLSWGVATEGATLAQASDIAAASAGRDAEHLTPRAPMASVPGNATSSPAYLMRTEAGQGPLELLALRDFTLPSRIFVTASAARSPSQKR